MTNYFNHVISTLLCHCCEQVSSGVKGYHPLLTSGIVRPE